MTSTSVYLNTFGADDQQFAGHVRLIRRQGCRAEELAERRRAHELGDALPLLDVGPCRRPQRRRRALLDREVGRTLDDGPEWLCQSHLQHHALRLPVTYETIHARYSDGPVPNSNPNNNPNPNSQDLRGY